MPLTDEQRAIREAFASLGRGDHLKVIAFAGAGKTTTLKACAEARKSVHGLYLAFNKSIAEEAKLKFAHTKCAPMTMHGLAYRAMIDYMDKPANLNANTLKSSRVMDQFHIPKIRGWGEYRVAAAAVRTMSAFASSADTDFSPKHAESALIESLGDPDFIEIEEKAGAIRDTIDKLSGPLVNIAQQYWLNCMDAGQYSHDMYLKMLDLDDNIRAKAFSRYKYIMLDEAQDTNPVQRSILEKTGISIIAVGDPYQQIYSWRGAENALEKLPGKERFLTQSFRFGDNIAAIARKVLSSTPGGGPEQRLIGAGPGDMSGYQGPKGAILCRTNIGMLDEAIKHVNKGFRVHVDNIEGLLTDVLSAQALKEGRMQDVKSADLKPFDSWEELQTTAEEGADPGLSKLVNLVRTNRVGDVRHLKNAQAPAESATLVVYTGHRSKGLEFPAVMLGDDWPDVDVLAARYKRAEQKSEKHMTLAKESYNTLYVAVTRAMLRCKGFSRILEPERDALDIPYDPDVEAEYTPG